MELSPRTENAGQYFKALAICRDGSLGRAEARRIFEELTDQSSPIFNSLSLAGIAQEEIYYQGTPSPLSVSLTVTAARLSYQAKSLLPFLQCQSDLSIHRSLDGDHQGALLLLQGVAKLMESVKGVYPALYCNYLNSLAYELAALGEVAAAWHYNAKALASPYAARYPEWRETRLEIAEQLLPKPSHSQISVPPQTQTPYEYCFENVYRLTSFYDYHPRSRQQPAEPQPPRNQASLVYRFPSLTTVDSPRRPDEGVFEVRLVYHGRRYPLFAIPEVAARRYTRWFNYLDQLPPLFNSEFLLEIVFNNGSQEFLLNSKPVTRATFQKLKLPEATTETTKSKNNANDDSLRLSTVEIFEIAKMLLAMITEDCYPLPPELT